MTLNYYLAQRSRFELVAAVLILLLFTITNATSIIIENYQEGRALQVGTAFALEVTSNFSHGILIPVLLYFLRWLNLSIVNFRWRVLWHVPGYVVFCFAHVSLMLLFRELVWAASGGDYEHGSLAIYFLYESRKDLLTYVGIVLVVAAYRFVLDRLQGEAKFLSVRESEVNSNSYKQQFLVKMLDKEYLVKVNEIESVSSASNYVLLNCGERSYPMRQTMAALTEQLDPARFMRVHRTAIVNLAAVKSLAGNSELQVQLLSGASVPVSKTYQAELRRALADLAS